MRWWPLAWIAAAGCGRIGFGEPAPGPTPDAAPVLEGLVAWYPMDSLLAAAGAPAAPAAPAAPGNVTAQPVVDATGRGHDGACDLTRMTPPRCPTLTGGQLGDAYHFDGTAMILVESAPDLKGTAGFTVTAWLRLDTQPATARACATTKGLGAGQFNSWALCIEPSRQVFFYTVSGTAPDNLYSMTTVPAGAWHHLAIRWDGVTKQAFLDGAEVARSEAAIDFDGQSIRIGGDLDGGNPTAPFLGDLDEIRVYDRPITDAELAELAAPPGL